MTVLKCIGRDGIEREFACRIREEPFFGTTHLFVRPIDHQPQDEFELVLKEESADVMRVKMMNHHYLEIYAQKGIPEAAIIYAAAAFQKTVESSPSAPSNGQWRIPAATSVWERLRAQGKATYSSETDIYRTIV